MAASYQPPVFARMAGHPLRWRLLRELAFSDRRVGELAELSGQPQSLVSYHLNRLRASGLVASRRSSFDGRDVYYRLDLAACAESLAAAAVALHPGLAPAPGGVPSGRALGTGGQARLLFMCTGNSARSQLAEALARKRSRGRVRAVSAGSKPKPVHGNTVRVLASYGIDAAGSQSRHFSTFTDRHFDTVITLCDRVRESCPRFPGSPGYIHWSIADPAAGGGDDDALMPAFEEAAADIDLRVRYLLAAVPSGGA